MISRRNEDRAASPSFACAHRAAIIGVHVASSPLQRRVYERCLDVPICFDRDHHTSVVQILQIRHPMCGIAPKSCGSASKCHPAKAGISRWKCLKVEKRLGFRSAPIRTPRCRLFL